MDRPPRNIYCMSLNDKLMMIVKVTSELIKLKPCSHMTLTSCLTYFNNIMFNIAEILREIGSKPRKVAFCLLALGRTSKLIPPPWYKGGGGVDGVFVMLQYFKSFHL